jgi:hypothetical protein
LPTGTTLGGVMLASDATQLSTHSGDVAAHAVYMSLANIEKSTRASTSENAWILVAYIPKSKFEHTMASLEHRPKAIRQKLIGLLNRRLFHRCMEIITRPLRRTQPHDTLDPVGNVRSVLYELVAYVADLEEQWTIACTGKMSCPHCDSHGTNLGSERVSSPRSPSHVLQTIRTIKKDYEDAYGRRPNLEEFLDLAQKYHLNGVDKPFWRLLPRIDIFRVLSLDLLHGFHKFFYDHVHKYNLIGMGKDEYDARIRSQIHLAGDRAFPQGISHISQMTGIEHRALERLHLCIVANAPEKINRKVTRATRAAMDCIYLAQLPIHSERSLAAYYDAYEDLMDDRWAWVENGSRQGATRKEPLDHFNIPKMHVIRHLDEHVRLKGTADNYSTETMEHLHVNMVKDAYRASNRRQWKWQTVRWLTRREKIRDYEEWMVWCEQEREKEKDERTSK